MTESFFEHKYGEIITCLVFGFIGEIFGVAYVALFAPHHVLLLLVSGSIFCSLFTLLIDVIFRLVKKTREEQASKATRLLRR